MGNVVLSTFYVFIFETDNKAKVYTAPKDDMIDFLIVEKEKRRKEEKRKSIRDGMYLKLERWKGLSGEEQQKDLLFWTKLLRPLK